MIDNGSDKRRSTIKWLRKTIKKWDRPRLLALRHVLRMMKQPAKLAYTIDELRAATGIGRSHIYDQVKRGELPKCKIGKRTLFLAKDVKQWLNKHRVTRDQ